MRRIRLLVSRHRKAVCLSLSVIALLWTLTGVWGIADVRRGIVFRQSREFEWPEADIRNRGPARLRDALQEHSARHFVGNALAVAPLVVRIDVGYSGRSSGTAERAWVFWCCGLQRVVRTKPLWNYEAHDGLVHGMDYGAREIIVLGSDEDREPPISPDAEKPGASGADDP